MNDNKASIYTKQDPFSRNERRKVFYHPSSQKEGISTSFKTKLLSNDIDTPENFDTAMGSIEKAFHSADQNNQVLKDESGSSKYDESWSSTLPSFQETPVITKTSFEEKKQKEHSIEDYIEHHGTLSKFVQRFRQQPPLSRQEREETITTVSSPDFWWLSTSEPSSIENHQEESTDSYISSTPPHPRKKVPIRQKLVSSTDGSQDIGSMQIRANRLLELSGSTLNSGSSTTILSQIKPSFSKKETDVTNPWKETKPIHTNYTIQPGTSPSVIPTKTKKTEDDILYQWRLARKIELASTAVDQNIPFRSYATKNMQYIAPNSEETKQQSLQNLPFRRTAPKNVQFDVPDTVRVLTKEAATETEQESPQNETVSSREAVSGNGELPNRAQSNDFCKEFLQNNKHLQQTCGCSNQVHCGGQFGGNNVPNIPPCVFHPYIHTVYHGYHQQQRESLPRTSTTSTGVQVSTLQQENICDQQQGNPKLKTCIQDSTKNRDPIINQVIAQHIFPEEGEASKNENRDPVINQVIAQHIFPGDDELSKNEVPLSSTPTKPCSPEPLMTLSLPPTKKIHIEAPTPFDSTSSTKNDILNCSSSSSEGEFEEDEILQDLRKRRKEIKKKLRDIYLAWQ